MVVVTAEHKFCRVVESQLCHPCFCGVDAQVASKASATKPVCCISLDFMISQQSWSERTEQLRACIGMVYMFTTLVTDTDRALRPFGV
jgi:hypothetical protein